MEELTPQQLTERAQELRECARRARTMAQTLGGYLTTAATLARQEKPVIWSGPYAESTTTEICDHDRRLRSMAGALQGDASRWDREAQRMEELAAKGDD